MTSSSESVETENALQVLQKLPIQLHDPKKITNTLQGSIWRATIKIDNAGNTNTVVVKLTNRNQHKNSISIVNNVVYPKILENIVSEQSILKHLTQQKDCAPFITKFVSFLKTDDFFLLIQEDGGYSLFNFAKTAHELITRGKIDIAHWKKLVQVIFKQLVESIAYIHSKGITHNDISLENYLINDVGIDVDEKGKIKFKTDDVQIKLCDFGLAELHTNSVCLSSKHCGKTNYKSPEVMRLKRNFNGKKNDIWGIGVCLFLLSFGCHPWYFALETDEAFRHIMDGQIFRVLRRWNVLQYIDANSIDLFQLIFKYETDRISVRQLKQHPFVA